jgi:hypothetical protein
MTETDVGFILGDLEPAEVAFWIGGGLITAAYVAEITLPP